MSTRKDIYDLIKRKPGTHTREITRALGLGIGTVDYHLHLLWKYGYIRYSHEGRKHRYRVIKEYDDDDATWKNRHYVIPEREE